MTKVNRKSDLFRIGERLRHINRDWQVFYNGKAARYEVHLIRGQELPNMFTLSFIVPSDRLDARTIDYAQKTRRQNDTQIEEEITRHNLSVTDSARATLEAACRELERRLEYAGRAGHSVDFTKDYIKEF